MNLFVLLKQVPGTSNVKMDEKTGTMVRTDRENVINPLDENALEAALELGRSIDGSKVTVLSMGPSPASRALKEAIAMGADEAHLLCHRGFAGSDTLATARALALAIAVSYTHLRAHETVLDLVCRLLLEKKNKPYYNNHSTMYSYTPTP